MKKIFVAVIAVLCLVANVNAQNFQVFYGRNNEVRLIGEQQRFTDKVFDYAYVEAGTNGAYVQLIHEQTLWSSLALHLEGRTTFNEVVGIVGLGWTFGFETGTIGAQALYRHDATGPNWQTSGVYSFDWGWCDLYGYLDFWGQNSPNLYSETRFYIKVFEHLRIGGIADISYFGQWGIAPYLGVKYTF